MSFVEQKMPAEHKILRHAGEMIADGEDTFWTSYIGEIDELVGVTLRALTYTCLRISTVVFHTEGLYTRNICVIRQF